MRLGNTFQKPPKDFSPLVKKSCRDASQRSLVVERSSACKPPSKLLLLLYCLTSERGQRELSPVTSLGVWDVASFSLVVFTVYDAIFCFISLLFPDQWSLRSVPADLTRYVYAVSAADSLVIALFRRLGL